MRIFEENILEISPEAALAQKMSDMKPTDDQDDLQQNVAFRIQQAMDRKTATSTKVSDDDDDDDDDDGDDGESGATRFSIAMGSQPSTRATMKQGGTMVFSCKHEEAKIVTRL
jgi:hypothetical protein